MPASPFARASVLIASALPTLFRSGSSRKFPVEASTASAMPATEVDVLIVGGGLAGLLTAHRLLADNSESASPRPSIRIVEARERLGGRICAVAGVDLGGSWTWPSKHSDVALTALARELGVSAFPQPAEGNALVERFGKWQQVDGGGESACGPGGYRFAGTSTSLTCALEGHVRDAQVPILTGAAATKVFIGNSRERTIVEVRRRSEDGTDEDLSFSAKVVVLAAPPRVLLKTINFSPALGANREALMAATPTWMADTAKIVAYFPGPIWKEKSLSGFCMLQSGPMTQVWDASDKEREIYALAGFAFGADATSLADSPLPTTAVDGIPADSFDSLPAVVKRAVNQMVTAVGQPPIRMSWKSWQDEPWTGAGLELRSRGGVGHPELRQILSGSIVFAGTETEEEHGHLEGAVKSGCRAAEEAFELLNKFGC